MMTKRKKYKLQQLLQNIEEICFVSLPNKYAKKQTKTAMGNGIAISSKDEQQQKDANTWAKKNNIQRLANTTLYWSKILGRIIVSPTITDKKEMMFQVSYPLHDNRVSHVIEEGVQAVVYKRPTQDDQNWLIKEVWDTEKVHRFWVNKNNDVQTSGANLKAPYQLEEFYYHRLGYLPVFEYWNFDVETFEYGPRTLSTDKQLAFDADVQYLNDLYNLVLQVSFIESVSTQTYLSFNVDPGTLQQIRNNNIGLRGLLLQKIAATSKKVDVERNGKVLEMIQGTFQAGAYVEMAIAIEKMFAEGVGSSFQADGQAQATATEIVYTNSDDEKTANEDSLKLTTFFENMLSVIHGEDPYSNEKTFTIKIIGNKVLSDMDQLDLETKKYNAGIITKEQLIQSVMKLDEEDAKIQKEKTDEESEEEHKKFMDMSGAMMPNDPKEPAAPGGINPNKGVEE